jgi:hypothetical protein
VNHAPAAAVISSESSLPQTIHASRTAGRKIISQQLLQNSDSFREAGACIPWHLVTCWRWSLSLPHHPVPARGAKITSSVFPGLWAFFPAGPTRSLGHLEFGRVRQRDPPGPFLEVFLHMCGFEIEHAPLDRSFRRSRRRKAPILMDSAVNRTDLTISPSLTFGMGRDFIPYVLTTNTSGRAVKHGDVANTNLWW